MSIYKFKANTRTKEKIALEEYRGKVMLIVNTASKCKLTPQFTALEKLNQDYKDKGLQVLGFPCNQFANQDPADNATIKQFCQVNYGVTFPMFARIMVNGKGAHPLYTYLKKRARGWLWSKRIKWNFTKFLVDHQGNVVKRYAPTTKPEQLRSDIEALLAKI